MHDYREAIRIAVRPTKPPPDGFLISWLEPCVTTLLVHLRDIETGDAAVLEMDYADANLDGLRYHWREGNYGCDCNRSNLLAEAIDGAYDTDLPCNAGPNRIAVDRILTPSGLEVYRDAC